MELKCGHCGQTVSEDDAIRATCPNCKQMIDYVDGTLVKKDPVQPELKPAPPLSAAPEPPPAGASTSPKTRRCSFCSEEIIETAAKCKHCGEFLTGGDAGGAEEIIWAGHPAPMAYFLHWIIGVLCLPLLGLGLFIIIYAILDRKARKFTHTTRKVIAQEGVIARRTSEVAIRDIRTINLRQGIAGRLFGFGSVLIGSAGTGGLEVVFIDIAEPEKIRDAIRQAKEKLDR